MAAGHRRKRNALLARTETGALALADRYAAGKFDRDNLNRRLGTVRRRKMGKHFLWAFDDRTEAISSTRKQESIPAEERLDGP